MRNLYGVLSISVLACVAVNSAYGALASKGYVDSWKVDMLQGVEKANRALVTNQFGKVIVGQIIKDMIADGAVTTAKIADENVTDAKIESVSAAKVTGLATVATSGSYNDLSNKPTIPTVGNGTITIKQTGKSDQTFTVNQGGNTTITLSDNDTKYTLPAATASALGGVKIGANVSVTSDGTISVAAPKTKVSELTNDAGYLTTATLPTDKDTTYTAGKHVAISDANVITTTYKAGTNIAIADDGTISATDTKYTLPTASASTKGGVKIGANVNVASDGTISVAAPKTKVSELTNDAGYLTTATLPKVDNASAADTATKATQDASGNVITETYATKTEVTNKIGALDGTTTGTGNVVTSVTQTDGKIAVTKGNVQAVIADVADTAVSGQYVSAVSQSGGKITVTRANLPTVDTTTPVTNAINALDVTDTVVAGQYVSGVSETDGKIKVTRAALPDVDGKITTAVNALDSSVTGDTGKVVTSVTQTDGKITGTMDYIKVPVGSATAPTSMANIWIE